MVRSGMVSGDGFVLDLPATIRTCCEEDLPRLEWFGAFTDHRAIIRDAYDLQCQGEAVMLVAVVGGFPVGQAWLDLRPRLDVPFPMVWAVRVLEPFQGAGLGTRLMAAVDKAAVARGCVGLQLGVEETNTRARAFYERLGWEVVGERREGCGADELREWVMARRLTDASPKATTYGRSNGAPCGEAGPGSLRGGLLEGTEGSR